MYYKFTGSASWHSLVTSRYNILWNSPFAPAKQGS